MIFKKILRRQEENIEIQEAIAELQTKLGLHHKHSRTRAHILLNPLHAPFLFLQKYLFKNRVKHFFFRPLISNEN